jgi:hypothetical protein
MPEEQAIGTHTTTSTQNISTSLATYLKNVAIDSIHETAHYKFGRQLEEANEEAEE